MDFGLFQAEPPPRFYGRSSQLLNNARRNPIPHERYRCRRRTFMNPYGRLPTHGHCVNGKVSPTYQSWSAMKQRCSLPGTNSYDCYGGKGIKVCERWMRFENFLADMGVRPSLKHSIERNDNDGNYEPNNCRWATAKEQANHRATNVYVVCNGSRMTIAQAARTLGLGPDTMRKRLLVIGDPDIDVASVKWKRSIILTPAFIEMVKQSIVPLSKVMDAFGLSETQYFRIRKGQRGAG